MVKLLSFSSQEVKVPENGGVLEWAKPVDIYPDVLLEGLPNRDSTIYKDLYGIPEAHSILRGALRYQVHVLNIEALNRITIFHGYIM